MDDCNFFFCKYSFWLNPIPVAIIPNINGEFCFFSLALEVTFVFLCPYFPCGRLSFSFVGTFLTENMSEVVRQDQSLVCSGPGTCPCRGVCVRGCSSWAVVSCSHSRLMMSSPQVAVLLCDMMACLLTAKDLFTRCEAGIQADSGAEAKLHCDLGFKLSDIFICCSYSAFPVQFLCYFFLQCFGRCMCFISLVISTDSCHSFFFQYRNKDLPNARHSVDWQGKASFNWIKL